MKEKEKLKKVIFNEKANKYSRDYGEGMVPITQAECYRFVNSLGVKCIGGENGYAIYAK